MDAKTLLQKETLSKEIFERLSKIEPKLRKIKKGILAGGSVANVILSIIDKKKYPINDIDIFIDKHEEMEFLKKEINLQKLFWLSHPRTTGEILAAQGSYGEININNIDGYQIIETFISDKINIVNISIHKDNLSKKKDAEIVINAFDINQTQVAIDLETKELVYTNEFVEFLNTRQLKMMHPSTPIQSLIRMLNKQKELNAFVDIERELYKTRLYTTIAFKKQDNFITNKVNINTKVAILYKENFKQIIDKHFTVKKDNNKLSFIPKEPVLGYDNIHPYNIQGLSKLLNIILYGKKAQRELVSTIIQTDVLKLICLSNPDIALNAKGISLLDIYEADKSIKEFFEVDNIFHPVPSFFSLPGNNFDLEKIINIGKIARRILKEFPETFAESTKRTASNYILESNHRFEYIENQYENLLKILTQNELPEIELKDPLDISNFEFKDFVKELTTELAIYQTANEFDNCLYRSNYQMKVKEGKSLLFVIETPLEKSILEVNIEMEYGIKIYTIIQHLTYKNNTLKYQLNHNIAMLLVDYLNRTSIDELKEKVRKEIENQALAREYNDIPF